jgi:hypothetical protein
MERTRLLKPGSTSNNLQYYSASDLYVGGTITAFSTSFTLIDADEYVFSYMESEPNLFPRSHYDSITKKLRQYYVDEGAKHQTTAEKFWEGTKEVLRQSLIENGASQEGEKKDYVIDRRMFVRIGVHFWGECLTHHVTYASPLVSFAIL